MTTLAIIPARGGSKGIKNKNIVDLAGKPLISYSIEALLKSNEVDYIAVSSDSEKILNTALEIEQSVIPIIRPESISGDSCTSESAILHSISAIEEKGISFDRTLFVQATSPLTESIDFDNLLKSLIGHDSAAFYVEDYGFYFDLDDMNTPRLPRQRRTPRKREAGNAWAFLTSGFKNFQSRLFGDIALCKLDPPKDLEIDEPSDLDLISSIVIQRQKQLLFRNAR